MTGAKLFFLKLEPSGFLGKLTEVFQRMKDEKLWGRDLRAERCWVESGGTTEGTEEDKLTAS